VRAVTDGFSRDELVETAGFVSLATGLCRLSVVLDAC
jgi:hypothetical protein